MLVPRRRIGLVAAVAATGIGAVGLERSPAAQEGAQVLLVLLRQLLVQGALVGGVVQQLRGVAEDVRLGGAVPDRVARRRARPLVVHVGVGVRVREDLVRHTQLADVVQGDHPLGDAGRTGVHVDAVGEPRGLPDAVDVGLGVPAADREGPPAGPVAGLEHRHPVAGLLQLVGRGEACGARSDDDHLLRGTAGQREVAAPRRDPCLCSRLGGGGGGQTHRAHGREHDTGAGARADGLEEVAAGDAGGALLGDHGPYLSFERSDGRGTRPGDRAPPSAPLRTLWRAGHSGGSAPFLCNCPQ